MTMNRVAPREYRYDPQPSEPPIHSALHSHGDNVTRLPEDSCITRSSINCEHSQENDAAPEITRATNDAAKADALFKQLVHDHRKRLYRFILKNIGNASDAEDLMQQAFLEAARSYATYRGESALSTWLYGIAMNLTRNYLSRSPHRKYDFVDEQSLESLSSGEVDPADALSNRQALNALQQELTDLPAEMREVLLLVALEEVSYEEAAVMLSIPVGTVRSRVSRARARLRGRLRESGIELDF